MPTNRELDLERMKIIDEMNDKIDNLLDLVETIYLNTQSNSVTKSKKNARKSSKSS